MLQQRGDVPQEADLDGFVERDAAFHIAIAPATRNTALVELYRFFAVSVRQNTRPLCEYHTAGAGPCGPSARTRHHLLSECRRGGRSRPVRSSHRSSMHSPLTRVQQQQGFVSTTTDAFARAAPCQAAPYLRSRSSRCDLTIYDLPVAHQAFLDEATRQFHAATA
ncbi:MAG: FCD domain-containing protein [Rhizobiales bacterium]|nr:FCD domain-containing protein [Hyphomicrobiales bacterium]